MHISKRCCGMTPFLVMEILEAAQAMERAGRSVIHLEVGEPDFDTPDCVKRAACRALDNGHTHYTHSLGLLELREAISEDYRKRYGVTVDPANIAITQGTSPAMLAVFSAILEAGDKVVTSDPCYACYDNFITFAGAEPVKVPVSEDDAFQYRVSAIQAALDDKVRAILINSPANPTGSLLPAERMRAIAELAEEKNLWIVSDEIYHGLVYEGQEHSILEYTDRAFVFNGFSKLYAMTGWRLGYVIAPPAFIRTLQTVCQNFFISANAMSQWAGLAALKEAGPDVARMVATYDKRRIYILDRLKAMGFVIRHDPTGAFYVLVNMRRLAAKFDGSSLKLAYDILDKTGVGVTPGIDFGQNAEGFIRFSYANSLANIAEAMDRLEQYLKEHHAG
ncbi:MAG: pyridoxal phosphate-dependent aminotransferase [Pseudodesulfovibrio sp.]|uniref:Aminotransferase n=1 Tax=Pseudodesulfovibrio aespoeensis (strain ATCC 700646 / DSM 10631 / Aspo-2) TaxID=643562 RepID=E6VUX2_PSEA9|nr:MULTISPECIES: pyridoxal phosphate-dependent aminotransferase [Pseudodesulfovibrio]MBU4244747.1 pyridoxal phosphate-dependent aminotransferase [Pseudomonadota bacterium]ADU63480.1 aminotransferase class I and II [Pseudodesulfovibrio aespoeensis Aspo-2]MBU4377709.1 pyridoxal phosphate-dependent aminotransferase [Pseudomonadota bacterium]MBU4476444.1 pyridoxal phosphate-dependent aminotransferase [Pseudomonadota bacterium]MBU4516485.1 pyridoxal phosphate-dependent aminotransferase [Pseudomonad